MNDNEWQREEETNVLRCATISCAAGFLRVFRNSLNGSATRAACFLEDAMEIMPGTFRDLLTDEGKTLCFGTFSYWNWT